VSSRAKKARHTSHHHYPKRDSFPDRLLFLREKEKKRREKKGQSIERQTNLLVVVQFFFETKLLLFLNCVCGSCCAIDIVRVACCCYVCGFPEEGVRVRKKREDKKSELKPYTQSSSVPEKTLLT